MPRWDYQCPTCHTIAQEEAPTWFDAEAKEVLCPTCPVGTRMKRLPSSGSFVVSGYNEKNGYGAR